MAAFSRSGEPRSSKYKLSGVSAAPEGREAAPPPGGNTGGKWTGQNTLCIDTVGGSFPSELLETVEGELSAKLGPAVPVDRGFSGYKQTLRWDCGGFLAYTLGRRDAFLYLPGRAVELYTLAELVELFRYLEKLPFRCTRLDIAFDDQTGLVDMEKVHRAGEKGHYAGCRVYTAVRPRNLGKLTGDTAYFGTRGKGGSGRYGRIYNKSLEQKLEGGEHWVRVEVELSKTDEQSTRAFADVLACPDLDAVPELLGKLVGGSFLFLRERMVRLDRSPFAPWWQRIVQLLGAMKYRTIRGKTTLQRKAEWLVESVTKTLATVANAVDEKRVCVVEFVRGLVRLGHAKIDADRVRSQADDLSMAFVLRVAAVGRAMGYPPSAAGGGYPVAPF